MLVTTPSKQVRSARTMDAVLFVAAPTAPPPAEAPLAAIPGVRVVIYILYVFWALIIFGLVYAQRRSLKMPPSVLAIAGTRWCSAPADLSALAGLSTPTTRVSVDKRHFAALFSFRFSMTLWHFAVILGLILWRSEDPPEGGLFRTFSFFTVWNYCLQAVTWAVAASASAAALCTPRGPSPLLRIAAHVMLSVCVPMSILVSIVLWGVLFPYEVGHTSPPYRDLNFFSYCMHAINTIAFLTEAYCDRLLLHKGALGPILLWSMIYAVFVSIQNAYTNFWPYFFLALDTWAALGWYPALFAAYLAVYLLVWLLSSCKARLQPSLREEPVVSVFGPVLGVSAGALLAGAEQAP